MPPVYRMVETAVYSLLNFLPFLVLALYPFRHNLRFSKGITALLKGLLSIIQVLLGAWVSFGPGNHAAAASALSTALYAVFYFLAVKSHFGKTLFTLLMISNLANFAVISAKCLEGLLFPALATQGYRWSFSLMLLAVEAVLALPVFFYIKTVLTPAMEKEPSGFEWRYLWLIPSTFYLMWYYIFYGTATRSSLEMALHPKNALFLLVINIGAALVYYVVTRLISEQNKTLELQEENHQLTMQAVQYENLQEKIAEARRAKHDVRHHVALMREYMNSGRIDAVRQYLDSYNDSLPDDSLVRFCENAAANAILLYFEQQAKNNGIEYIVKADIPSDIFVSDTDMSVLFGNLIENAVTACQAEKKGSRKIVICAKKTGNSLCITVDNTFTGTLRHENDGAFSSTKHDGPGLGTQSVKSIAEHYCGVCRFTQKNGMFCASVMCTSKDTAK